jgi:cell division protease FtsH
MLNSSPTLRRAVYFAAFSAAVTGILRMLRTRSGKVAIPMVLFSKFFEDVLADRVAEVLMASDYFDVTLKVGAAGAAAAVGAVGEAGAADVVVAASAAVQRYRTEVVPQVSFDSVLRTLSERGVRFGKLQDGSLKRLLPMLVLVVPFIYLGLAWRMISSMYDSKRDGVGKKSVKKMTRERISFNDVAGVDGAKSELVEIVDFIRNPTKYTSIGAKLPRGVLMSGPSGTGKTLLARAVASEAGVPFIFCSASDFVEMLVGRGAARVRELFTQAQAAAQQEKGCLIFVDELDALAKARGGFNSNDEREQTLNQLLTEMDGFEGRAEGVVVIAATNRPEVLDPALIRPGRFDRHVEVGYPDKRGRLAILEVHVKRVTVAGGIDLESIAQNSPGFSGAMLANIINDAAMLAVRQGRAEITQLHLSMALGRAQHRVLK